MLSEAEPEGKLQLSMLGGTIYEQGLEKSVRSCPPGAGGGARPKI